MSIEMDAGAGVPRAPFAAANVEAEVTAAEADLVEARVILIMLAAVLGSSLLGVLVYLG